MAQSISSWADGGITSRFLSAEVTVCEFRESLVPDAKTGHSSADVFVPLPGERTLWVVLKSDWLAAHRDGLPGAALSEITPDPPYDCEVDGCEYSTDNYGSFLVHDQREHYPDEGGMIGAESDGGGR